MLQIPYTMKINMTGPKAKNAKKYLILSVSLKKQDNW